MGPESWPTGRVEQLLGNGRHGLAAGDVLRCQHVRRLADVSGPYRRLPVLQRGQGERSLGDEQVEHRPTQETRNRTLPISIAPEPADDCFLPGAMADS